MKTMIIFNPTAGQLRLSRQMDEVVQFLQQHGWDVDLRKTARGETRLFSPKRQSITITRCRRGGRRWHQQRSHQRRLVGSDVIFGMLPIGTTNVLALEVGVPVSNPLHLRPVLDSARVLVEGGSDGLMSGGPRVATS